MLIITDKIYNAIADQLVVDIDQKYFFSGSIEFDTEELYSTFTTSVIIDKKRIVVIEGVYDVFEDIIPVWWEFKTYQREGEVYNTFSWQEFKEFLPINRIE